MNTLRNPEKGVERSTLPAIFSPATGLNPEKGVESFRVATLSKEMDTGGIPKRELKVYHPLGLLEYIMDLNPEKGVESNRYADDVIKKLRIPKRELKELL